MTVLTITYRPGYIDTMTQCLVEQNLPRDRWEWVLVDDLHSVRHELVAAYVPKEINLRHMPPREIRMESATAIAVNTGLAVARGKLVYFMADYMYLHPTCLERHWDIYQKHGPDVFISGPIVDLITYFGASTAHGAPAMPRTIKVGDAFVTYEEHSPPLAWPLLKENWSQLIPENLISIWQYPMVLYWPRKPGKDWRISSLKNLVPIGRSVCQADSSDLTSHKHWWAGRNDSASLDLLRRAGGLDESQAGQHGGLENLLAQNMVDLGGRYLIDLQSPAMHLEHRSRKPEVVSWPTA